MAKQNAAPLTIESLDALVELAGILNEHGVYEVCVGVSPPRVSISFDKAVEAIRAARAVGVEPKLQTGVAQGVVRYECIRKGVMFYGVLYEKDLPSIGYHLVDGHPVPLDKSATA